MENLEEMLRNNKPEYPGKKQHKESLKRALLSSSYFLEEPTMNWLSIWKPRILILSSVMLLLTSVGVASYYVLTPNSAGAVLAEVAEALEEKQETEGKYYNATETIKLYENGQLIDELTAVIYEDFENDNSQVTITNNNGKTVEQFAYVDGVQYICETCSFDEAYIEKGIIADEDWDTLSMREIDAKLIAAGEAPIFDRNDPLYTYKPTEIESLTEQQVEELYKDYDEKRKIVGSAIEKQTELVWDQLWELEDNLDKTSREDLISRLNSIEGAEFLGQVSWNGFDVLGIRIEETQNGFGERIDVYFDANTYSYRGTAEYVQSNSNEFALASESYIQSESYSNTPSTISTEGLAVLDEFEADEILEKFEEEGNFEEIENLISEEDWQNLSGAEINEILTQNGLESIFEEDDPFYNLSIEEIENLSEEELDTLLEEYEEYFEKDDPFDELITEEDWDTLSMQQIDEKLVANGFEAIFNSTDPFYSLTPMEVEAAWEKAGELLADEAWSELSPAEINNILVSNNATPIYNENDPLYNYTFEQIENLSDEELENLYGDEEYEGIIEEYFGEDEDYLKEDINEEDWEKIDTVITEEDWDTLSMQQIDEKLIANGLEPIFDSEDPLYSFSQEEIDNLTDEQWDELFGYQEWSEWEEENDDTWSDEDEMWDKVDEVITEDDWNNLTLREIDEKLVANGLEAIFIEDKDEPFYDMTEAEIDSLTDEEWDELYSEYEEEE